MGTILNESDDFSVKSIGKWENRISVHTNAETLSKMLQYSRFLSDSGQLRKWGDCSETLYGLWTPVKSVRNSPFYFPVGSYILFLRSFPLNEQNNSDYKRRFFFYILAKGTKCCIAHTSLENP